MSTDTDEKLEAILMAFKSLEARVARIETDRENDGDAKKLASTTTKKLSIKEFLLESPPPTDIQRTLAIGYYLESHTGMPSFTKADLEKGYNDAKEPVPSNTGVNVRHCIKQGHMMEAEQKKGNKTAYVITRRGEEFVKAGYKRADGK